MYSKTKFVWLLSAMLLFALWGCSSAAPEEVPDDVSTATAEPSGYPAPDVVDSGQGYPLDDVSAEMFYANLTPNAPAPEVTDSLGALRVQLMYAGTDRPVRGQSFFIADMLPIEGVEDGFIPALDERTAPGASSDAQGVLVISNIQPGNYALVMMTPLGPILIEAEDTGNGVQLEIAAGEVTDLGEISVLLNPDPLEPSE